MAQIILGMHRNDARANHGDAIKIAIMGRVTAYSFYRQRLLHD